MLVEGYVDVIALAQAGIRNVVAPLGTSLTSDQIRLLKRFTDEFLVLFDGDRAGVAAAARAFTVFAEVGIFAEAVFLPEGHDPDTFVSQEGGCRDGSDPGALLAAHRSLPAFARGARRIARCSGARGTGGRRALREV